MIIETTGKCKTCISCIFAFRVQSSRENPFPYSHAGRPSASADIVSLDARVHKKEAYLVYKDMSLYSFSLL